MSEPELSEQELADLKAQMDKITVEDLLLQMVVTAINLGAQRAGLVQSPEEAQERAGQPPTGDPEQLRLAIEASRAVLPLLEAKHGEALAPIKETLSRLQMTYVQLTKSQGPSSVSSPEDSGATSGESKTDSTRSATSKKDESPADSQGPGPGQSSGRLWVPGQ